MYFTDDSLYPENMQPLIITAAPFGPAWLPGDADIPVTWEEQLPSIPRWPMLRSWEYSLSSGSFCVGQCWWRLRALAVGATQEGNGGLMRWENS